MAKSNGGYRDTCEYCKRPVERNKGHIISGILVMHKQCVVASRVADKINNSNKSLSA